MTRRAACWPICRVAASRASSASAARAAEAEEAREAATRQIGQQAARRVMQRHLLRGFGTWRASVAESSRIRRAASAMLPRAFAFREWQRMARQTGFVPTGGANPKWLATKGGGWPLEWCFPSRK